jgi:hypothetical protein
MEKSRIILYSWLLARTYHKNLMIWKKILSKSGEFRPIFLINIPLNRLKSYFSGEKFGHEKDTDYHQ